jgi:hypothetical protein
MPGGHLCGLYDAWLSLIRPQIWCKYINRTDVPIFLISVEDQKRKLNVIVETAGEVWGHIHSDPADMTWIVCWRQPSDFLQLRWDLGLKENL